MSFGRSALVILAVFSALAPAVGAETDWTMARYDEAQSGYTPEQIALPLSLCWQHNTSKFSDNSSAPALADGIAYFASGNKLYAVSVADGTRIWQYPSGDATLRCNIKTGITVWQDLVFFGGSDGNLYAVRAGKDRRGELAWAFPTAGPIRSSPVVSGGVLYVGSDDNNLYAIDARSGELVWTSGFRTRDDVQAAPALAHDLVLFASMDTHVYGASMPTGRLRWAFRLPMSPVRSAPVVAGNLVYIGAGSVIYVLSSKNGQLRYTINLPTDIAAPPAVAAGDVYVLCRNRKLYAYSTTLTNFKPKWERSADVGLLSVASPTVAGNVVFVGCLRGLVCAYSADDGRLLWNYTAAPSSVGNNNQRVDYTNVAAPPVVADGALFILTDDGSLRCFRNLAADNTPPRIYSVTPQIGTAMEGSPPIKISALIYDESTGIDDRSIQLMLDDEKVEHKFDVTKLTVSYETSQADAPIRLETGRHYLKLLARDWKGNEVNYSWSFLVDNSLPPKRVAVVKAKPKREPRRRQEPPTPPAPPAPASPGTPAEPGVPPGPGMPPGPGLPPMPPMPPGYGGPGAPPAPVQ